MAYLYYQEPFFIPNKNPQPNYNPTTVNFVVSNKNLMELHKNASHIA